LKAAGAELVPLSVDTDGLMVEEGRCIAPMARMAVVTPSHQYPLGAVMSLSRRLELLEWARENDAWILEDDYDSEYRYGGRPLSALQGLDNAGRVIYVGTFSKVLFPGIRLGYMVVPPGLSADFVAVRRSLDDQTPIAMQPVLTEFIQSGHFAAHIRRMRTLYSERQSVLLEALNEKLPDVLSAQPDDAGMHIVADLTPKLALHDTEIARKVSKRKISVYPLSGFFIGPPNRNGLVFGYAGVEVRDIKSGVATLSKVIQEN
jgi:GntR family transcriptional regulator/MocR family aminotransferase